MASEEDIGRDLGEARFRVDETKVMELARSLFDDDPVYRDEAAARAAGFDVGRLMWVDQRRNVARALPPR